MSRSGVPNIHQDIVRVGQDDIPFARSGDTGPTVVLVHGGAADHTDWAANIPSLATSYQVYAPDLIGFGRSPRGPGAYTVERLSGFLCDFMDALGVREAFLVGHSLGARACIEVARRTPSRVAGLVLTAPMGFGRLTLLGMALGTAGWALFKALRRPLPYPSLDVKLKDPDLVRLDDLATPTMVLWGRWDPYFSSGYARRVRDAIPNSQVTLFERSGHSPHRRQPHAFNQTVARFLSTLTG